MSSNFGKCIQVSLFGQSHSAGIGVVMTGIPAGHRIDMEALQAHMQRRAPGNSEYATPRKEADLPEILSGIVDGYTCGAPISAIIRNTNTKSKDYEQMKVIPRPGHADFTAMIRHQGFQDVRGGGHFSGRLTAPLCFAGAICMQILEEQGIYLGAHISSIAEIEDTRIDALNVTPSQLQAVKEKAFPTLCEDKGREMIDTIVKAKKQSDSVGGVIELCVLGMPVGVGEPMFEGIENKLAQAVFAIPAVKGIEFGLGFEVASVYGSTNNDAFYYDEQGNVKTKTNHHGGILGGMSSGMPIIMRAAFKPTPSIAREQESINIKSKEAEKLVIKGRHDPCIVPRAVPCVESAAAIALLDLLFQKV